MPGSIDMDHPAPTTVVIPPPTTLAALLAVGWLLAACGGESDGPGTWDASDPEQFCRGAATYRCQVAFDCLTPDELGERGLTTFDACVRDGEAACEGFLVADDSRTYDPAAGAACLEEMSTRACLDVDEAWLDAAACDDLLALRTGQVEFVWDPNSGLCDIPVRTVIVDVHTGPAPAFRLMGACTAGKTAASAEIPYGDYVYDVSYVFDDHTGSGDRNQPLRLASPMQRESL